MPGIWRRGYAYAVSKAVRALGPSPHLLARVVRWDVRRGSANRTQGKNGARACSRAGWRTSHTVCYVRKGTGVCASRPLRLVSEAVQLVHVEVLTVALTIHNARRATRWSRSDSTGMPGDRRVRDKAWLPLWPAAGEQVDLVARLSAQVAHPDSAHE